MHFIFESFYQAFRLIIGLNAELLQIIGLSFRVSGMALVLAVAAGVPLAAFLALKRLPGRGLIMSVINTCMGLPPVVVGLFIYLIFSRSGPLGFLGLLYTPGVMIIAQLVLAFPVVVALCHSAIVNIDPIIRQACLTLGATSWQAAITVIAEARYGILSGIIAAFGRLMAEVGAILIVGGNIAGYTRVMTTTIAMETDKGNFELALALGIILLGLSLIINLMLHLVQVKSQVSSR